MIFAGIPDVIGSPSLIYISNFNDPPQLENRFAWDRVRGSIMEDKLLGSSGGPPAKILSRPPLSPPPGGGYRYFQTLSIAARSSALFRSVQLPFSPVSFYLASFFPPSLFESLCSSEGRGGWGHLSLTISCRYGAMDGWKDLRNIRGIPFLFFVPLIL